MRNLLLVGLLVVAGACSNATVDKSSARATDQAPEASQVEVVRIPYDAAFPRYVVVVEPMTFDAEGGGGGSAPSVPGQRYGWGPWGWGLLPEGPKAEAYNPPPAGVTGNVGNAVANQLTTALSNVGNIIIVDYDHFLQNRSNPAKLVNRKAGEVGPFVLKGSITEFQEVAEAEGSGSGGSLGALGAAVGIAGAIAGSSEAAIAGTALGLANPTWDNKKAKRTGMVGMDIKIVNPQNGRLAGSVVANGSFTAVTAASGFSVFGIGKASNAFAQSALGQANRQAMNSATTQIWERLRLIR